MELYIHIPVCARKCAYCDFLSFPMGRSEQQRYKDTLLTEIRSHKAEADGQEITSIFIGGGTPSIFPAEWILEILETIKQNYTLSEQAEISIEANPGTVRADMLQTWKAAGINRISFGCQSSDNSELKRLGRIHTWERFLESYAQAREAGYSNINVDLMSALPGQTMESWEQTLRQTAELGPEHISAYSLIIEEGTPFYEQYGEESGGRDKLPDEDTERLMYERTAEILSEYGYIQYEISNYAKEGYACRHNIGYWTGIPYIGIGLGAASCNGQDRYTNTDDLQAYLSGDFARKNIEHLETEDLQAEFMILGLRMNAGVSEEEFERRFGSTIGAVYAPVLRKYECAGLLVREEGRIRLTREGISLSNMVMAEFLPD